MNNISTVNYADWVQSQNQEKIKQGKMFEFMNNKEYKIVKEHIFIYLEQIEGYKIELKKENKKTNPRKKIISDIKLSINNTRNYINALVRLFNDKDFKNKKYYFSDFINYDYDIKSILERIPEETTILF